MARVDDVLHAKLMAVVDKFLVCRGFSISEKTYHDGHMLPAVTARLQVTFSPTALHIRSKADRIAVHPDDGMAFYLESKTGGGRDLLIEALPLTDHMHAARRGVLCLYCCYHSGAHRGFWTHDLPPVRTLFIPPQRNAWLTEWYAKELPPLFPSVKDVKHLESRRGGSGDPFIAIDGSVVQTLPTWFSLIEEERKRWLETIKANL